MSTATITRPPRTLMEVFQSLPEGTMVQLIQNQLIMSPAPLDIHQKVLSEIYLALGSFVKQHHLGECRMAPYDVYLDKKNAFQPDIVFISKENLHLIKENGLHGAPDLVIEILSPSSAKYDLEEKKDVYERCGVKEYWAVDPATKSSQGYFLGNKQYGKAENTEGVIRSRLLKTEFKF